MREKIPLIARNQKIWYTGFLAICILLFVLTSWYTNFRVTTLVRNGDAFWDFITKDFLPPALPQASRIPSVFASVLVTLALALSSTTVAAVLAFFVSLFGSEKVSPFPRIAKYVRGFATFFAEYSGASLGVHSVFFSGNRNRRGVCSSVYYELCIYG